MAGQAGPAGHVGTLLRAQAITDQFVLAHGRAFYGLTTQAASTHAIAYYLVKRAGQVISQRDLVRGPRSLRNPAAERLDVLHTAIAPFVANRWLLSEPSVERGGPRWLINPNLTGPFPSEITQMVEIYSNLLTRMRGEP